MRRYLLFSLLLSVLLLSGCWQEKLPEDEAESLIQPEESEPENTRLILPEIFSLPYAPELTLDPVTCADGMQQTISSLLCEGLFRLGPNLEPEACLCESYSYDPSTYTYTFTLRSDVTFSDGSLLTADDVRDTLNRARVSERYAARLAGVAEISAEDPGLVTIVLSAPNTGFPALLDIPIIKSGSEKALPVGTGPYLLSTEQANAYLVANQSWWQGGGQPVDRIALVEASDQDTMLYRFTSHDVQLMTADLTGTNPIPATGSIIYQDVDTTILHYIGCNTTLPPLDDAALRQALWQGIDREQLVSAFLSGHGKPSLFPISPISSLYPESLTQPYSYASFTEALADIRVTRPLTLLVNEENTFKCAAAAQIAKDFTAAGISVEIKALSWAEYTAALATGQFDLYYGEVKLTADWNLSALLGTGGALNYGGWANSQTDQLLTYFAAADNRVTAAKQLCTHLQEQAPILPVYFKSTSVLMQAGVLEGLEPTMAEPFYNLQSCAIHLQEQEGRQSSVSPAQ